jgi:hypothetical protein
MARGTNRPVCRRSLKEALFETLRSSDTFPASAEALFSHHPFRGPRADAFALALKGMLLAS